MNFTKGNALKTVAMLVLAIIVSSCSKNNVKLETSTIKTPTMVCGTCAKTIQKAVYRVEGVKEVNVDVDKKFVEVKFVPLQTNLEYLESAITAAGYDANDKLRDSDAYEKLDACCKMDRK